MIILRVGVAGRLGEPQSRESIAKKLPNQGGREEVRALWFLKRIREAVGKGNRIKDEDMTLYFNLANTCQRADSKE
jgi:hypothetical protein